MLPAVKRGALCYSNSSRIRLGSSWSVPINRKDKRFFSSAVRDGSQITNRRQWIKQCLWMNQQYSTKGLYGNSSTTNGISTTATQRMLPFSTSIAAAVALLFGGAMGARWWYTSTMDRDSFLLNSKTGAPRQDQSKVTITMPASTVTQPAAATNATNIMLLNVDLNDLREFTETQQVVLQETQQHAKEQTQQILHEQLEIAFQDCNTRGISQFAKWYFSYTTTYKLLSIAMKSAAKHVLTLGRNESTVQQAVTRDLQLYICDKYQAMVLRPAVTDPKIHKAVLATLEQVYEESYQPAVKALEVAMQQFAEGHTDDVVMEAPKTTSKLALPPGAVVLELDWKAQLQKAVHLPVAYEKQPAEFSVAIIGASAMAGKAMGGTAVKAVSAKLAAPFATKAVGSTLGGKAAAGAAAGGVLAGGPLGAGMGAAIGIGMDMAVNKGISLMQQSTFEKDVRESLDATMLEWEEKILPEVDRLVQDEWFGQLQFMLQANVENSNAASTRKA